MAGAAGHVLKQVAGNELVDGIRQVAAGNSMLDRAVTARVLERIRSGPGTQPDELAEQTNAAA
jgi:two-component system, NarL family, response regulator DevR